MRITEHREHAQGLVALEEAHSAHVGGEIVDVGDSAAGVLAGVTEVEIGDDVLGGVESLEPLLRRLAVDDADGDALVQQARSKMPANKAAAARHENLLAAHP